MSSFLTSILKSVRVAESDFSFLDIGAGGRIALSSPGRVFFHLVLRGKPVLMTESGGHPTELAVGDYVFIMHDRSHSIGGVGPTEPLRYFDHAHENDVPNSLVVGQGSERIKTLTGCITLATALTPALLRILPGSMVVSARKRGIVQETMSVYESRQIYTSTRSPGGNEFLRRLVELLLVDAIRLCATNITLAPSHAMKMRGTPQIVDALQIMANELDRKWSVSSLAKRVNMSRSAFAAAFTLAVGKPPLHYLTELRMSNAGELLRSGNQSVKEIAYWVGYDSEVAFGRLFKRSFGMTPTEYRRTREGDQTMFMPDYGHWEDFIATYRS